MPSLHNDVFAGLSTITTDTENLVILSADPGLTWSNIATYLLGTKAAPTISAIADRSGGGREVTISEITDGSVSADGTASYYALTDDSATKILASGSIATGKAVADGETFTLSSFVVAIPDPI